MKLYKEHTVKESDNFIAFLVIDKIHVYRKIPSDIKLIKILELTELQTLLDIFNNKPL